MPSALAPRSGISAFLGLSLAFLGCATSPRARSVPTGTRLLDVPVTDSPSASFVRAGQPFCFVGVNNYYLGYKPRQAVLDVLEGAAALGFTVVRSWAFLDIGSLDGSVAHVHEQGKKEGVYFQAWDPARQRPVYNDGEDGLVHLDFVLHHARRLGLSVVLVLTNNWRDFGGMDQYLAWFGLSSHADFYADPRVRSAYRDYVAHLIGRTNSLDGVAYREDPAIFSWELANEPRVSNLDLPGDWIAPDPAPLTQWASEMSRYVKSLDPNHLVSVGDEGFLVGDERPEFQKRGSGVDHRALSALPDVDFATHHLYPDHWHWSLEQSYDWIDQHLQLGRELDKPVVLEEYGLEVRASNAAALERRRIGYTNYNRLMQNRGGAGTLVWHLAADVDGQSYPDYDQLTLYPEGPIARLLGGFAVEFSRGGAAACRSSNEPIAASPFVAVRSARR